MDMAESKNTMTFDLTSSKKLADIFAGLEVGDEVRLEIIATVSSKTPEQAKLAVSRIEHEMEDDDESESVDGSEMASSIMVEGESKE